jgi:hypothetical protein
MAPRPALTVLVLATAAPILLYAAAGLSTEAGSFSIAASLVYSEILAGVALVAIGTFYARRALTAVGAALLLAASIPLLVDGFFVFALLPAASSLILLSVSRPRQRANEADLGD